MQIIDHLLDAAPVVDTYVGDVGPRRADVVENHRYTAFGQFLHERRIHFRHHHGQARYAPADHQPDTGHQLFGAVIGIGHHHFMAAGVRVGFNCLVDVEEKRILHVGGDHTDSAALAAGQTACVEIG